MPDATPSHQGSPSVGSAPSLPPPLDLTVLQRLLAHCPPTISGLIEDAVPKLLELFAADRHFELESQLTALFGELSSAEAALSSDNAPPRKVAYDQEAGARGAGTGDDNALAKGPYFHSLQGVRIAIDFLKCSRLSTEALRKAKECRETLADIQDNSTWSRVRVDSNGHGTFYRSEPGLGSHSFKVVGIVKAGMVALASVLMELDMYDQWFPFCNRAEELSSVARFHKLSRFAIKVPWPLADREVAIGGYGVDHLARNTVVIRAVSLSEDAPMPNGQPPPPVLKGNVRADLKVGGFVLEAVTRSETKLAFIMNVDPKIPNIPIAVLNWVSGKMIWVLLYQIQKAAGQAMDPKSKYAQRQKERPDVYQYFAERAGVALGHLPD